MYSKDLDKGVLSSENRLKTLIEEGRINQYILDNKSYDDEISKLKGLDSINDELINSPKFALFRANLINFGFSNGLENDLIAFKEHIKHLKLYEVQQRVLHLNNFIAVDTSSTVYDDFKTAVDNRESAILVSYHYSNYKALFHYLLTLNIDLLVLVGKKQKQQFKDGMLDLACMYDLCYGYKSSVSFVEAEEKTSLIQIYRSFSSLGDRPKILLIYVDGNIGQMGHQIKNNSYLFRGVEVSMREGLNILLSVLRAPVYSVYVEDNCKGLQIKFLSKYSHNVGELVKSLITELEGIVSSNMFYKWECLMYLHHWIANKDSLPPQNRITEKIKVFSQGEWYYLDTYEYVYKKIES
jgi:hypothetical protein